MRSWVLLLCCMLLIAAPAFSAPKSSDLPKQILNARLVAVVVLTADAKAVSEFSRKITPEDRQLRESVEQEVRKWKRFTVVIDPSQADLLIAVRAGRRGSVSEGPRIGIGSRGPYAGSTSSVEAGPVDDQLLVYGGPDFDSAVLWRGHEISGLQGKMPLLMKFRDQVEAAAADSKKKP